jgi:hypothetical protein
MPCLVVKELEANSFRFMERRRTASQPDRERRKAPTESRRVGLFRAEYMIRAHRAHCADCQQPG